VANTLLMKKSGTASAVPASLSYGELAINYADGLLYYKNAAGAVVPLTNGAGTVITGNKGDITVSGTGETWTINASAVVTADIADANVTYAKLQNVSATDRLLGRSTAGAGVVEEIVCTAAGRALIDDADAAAQRTTLGLGTIATAATGDYLARAGGTMTGVVQVTAGTAAAPGVAISGDTDTGITQAGGANTLSVATNGVERWRVGSNGATQSVIPGGTTLLPAFDCRAWVNFNGTGTVAIRGSGNVSSITDGGVGNYTVNLTTAMPDTNYCANVSMNIQQGVTFSVSCAITLTSASAVQIFTAGNTSNVFDCPTVCVSVFR
jgi:hypothetical protein